ncbi:hypothetical protein ACQCVM_02520 [Rossellomorea aquimaris]|uniref:hypothetical protein n=1 Tax=Bacillaceae TaxID=186817 RepID=UPI0011EEFECA|nr:hypothetical protein [Bacillus sp. CH30_1T]KAA0560782.1 hypothetical protein F0342_21725 [Bacillus sp. CH30_1T]
MPYTLVLLMIVLSIGFAAKDLFISKYLYLTNMKYIYERNVSVSHAILLEMESGVLASKQWKGNYGEIVTRSDMDNPDEIRLEVTFKRDEKLFLPTTVVYNRETKHIISWE